MVLELLTKYSKENKNKKAKISKAVLKEIQTNKSFEKGIVELAELSDVSQTAVTRFVKLSLKLTNYKNFVAILNEEINSYFNSDYDINNLSSNSKQIVLDISKTLDNIDEFSIKEATNIILSAERFNVCAIGGNASIKTEIEHRLSKIGKHVMLTPDWHHMLMNVNYMHKNDVIIAITYSGDKNEISTVIKKAKEKGIKIIVFSGPFSSYAKSNADILFEAQSTDPKFRSFTFTSRLCFLAIWETVFKSILGFANISSDVIEDWKWERY